MHGISKQQITEAHKLAERKRAAELAKLTHEVLRLRKDNILTKDALMATTKLLQMNADFYTIWNYRRTIILELQKTMSEEEQKNFFKEELIFLEGMIKENPKSYTVWFHREWVGVRTDTDWNRELMLCKLMLQKDNRNFHCWSYRRFAARQANAPAKSEFDFTTEKITENFSNYSAWHQRTAMLREQYRNDLDGLQKALESEFALVQNAFYTAPEDQSAWFYYRWLVEAVPHPPETFARELAMLDELLSVEPDTKWPLLTKVFLLKKHREVHGPQPGDTEQISTLLKKLITIDPWHVRYYEDMATTSASK